MAEQRLSVSCLECESLGECPGRPPAREPTADKGCTIGELLGEATFHFGVPGGEHYCKVAQHIRWSDGSEVVRIGYYNIKANGKAYWGQFATMFNPGEIGVLLERARVKGILPF